MTTKTKSTALATMWAFELHRVLSDAAVFAGHDETMSSINVVHVEYTGTHMLAVATDQFRLGVSKADLCGDGEDLPVATFNLALRDVVQLIKLSKTSKRDTRSRFVQVSSVLPPSNEYGTGTVTFKFSDGASLDVTPQDTEFPKWRQLFPKTGSQKPRDTTAFTAEYLASFGKVNGGDSQRLVMYSHDDVHGRGQRPTTFTIGDNFVGLLMPVKLADDEQREWVKPEWMG
jgi:hypothetical protein